MSQSVILFLAANPADDGDRTRVSLDEECAAVERELRMTPRRDKFRFVSKWAVTVDELMRHLNELAPTIIHFSGHSGATGLVLVGDRGKPQPVKPEALARMVKATADRTRLVVLNACYSEDQAEAMREAVGCAIGMSGTISDEDAQTFAVGFYRALGYGKSVGNAYRQALATLAGKNLNHPKPRCLPRPDVDIDAMHLDEAPVPSATTGQRPVTEPSPGLHQSVPLRHERELQPDIAPPTKPEPQPPRPDRYDLFLAHASTNKPSARDLYDLLQPEVRVFLDERSLRPGDRWDLAIPAAQRASRATVFLVSSRVDSAWYLGAELVAAIELHGAAPENHLLLPVLLDPGVALPYALKQVQAIDAHAVGGLAGVSTRLREVVAMIRAQRLDSPPTVWAPKQEPTGDGSVRCVHFRLHDRLCKLTDVMFEQIVFHAGIERATIAPRAAPLAERALDVAQLAALDQAMCRRLSAELDRRAPWTQQLG